MEEDTAGSCFKVRIPPAARLGGYCDVSSERAGPGSTLCGETYGLGGALSAGLLGDQHSLDHPTLGCQPTQGVSLLLGTTLSLSLVSPCPHPAASPGPAWATSAYWVLEPHLSGWSPPQAGPGSLPPPPRPLQWMGTTRSCLTQWALGKCPGVRPMQQDGVRAVRPGQPGAHVSL